MNIVAANPGFSVVEIKDNDWRLLPILAWKYDKKRDGMVPLTFEICNGLEAIYTPTGDVVDRLGWGPAYKTLAAYLRAKGINYD